MHLTLDIQLRSCFQAWRAGSKRRLAAGAGEELLPCRARRMVLNCDMTQLAVVDGGGSLWFYDMAARSARQSGREVLSCSIQFDSCFLERASHAFHISAPSITHKCHCSKAF